jgi:non-ribosomal peptide synthase protein (TIGR01720 family)
LEDWLRAYAAFNTGQMPTLPGKTSAFKQWAEYLQRQANDASLTTISNVPSAWAAPPSNTALPSDVNSDAVDTVATQASLRLTLSHEDSVALLDDVSTAYNTDLQDALLSALLHAWWTPRLYLDIQACGRDLQLDTLDLSRSVGWFTYVYPVCLDLPEQQTLIATLKQVKEQLRGMPGKGLSYGVQRYLRPLRPAQWHGQNPPTPPSVLLVCQDDTTPPQALSAQLPAGFELTAEAYRFHSAPENLRSHGLEIHAQIARSCLTIDWRYNAARHQSHTIEALANRHMQFLRELIAHCRHPAAGGYTPSDFPEADLDQDELDDLLGGLDL